MSVAVWLEIDAGGGLRVPVTGELVLTGNTPVALRLLDKGIAEEAVEFIASNRFWKDEDAHCQGFRAALHQFCSDHPKAVIRVQ